MPVFLYLFAVIGVGVAALQFMVLNISVGLGLFLGSICLAAFGNMVENLTDQTKIKKKQLAETKKQTELLETLLTQSVVQTAYAEAANEKTK